MNRMLTFAAVAALGIGFAPQARADEPGEIFGKKCATCHGKDGKGNTPMGKKSGVKDLTDPGLQAKLNDAEVEAQITNGLKDKDTGKEKMPAFKEKLSGDDIKALTKFVHTFKG